MLHHATTLVLRAGGFKSHERPTDENATNEQWDKGVNETKDWSCDHRIFKPSASCGIQTGPFAACWADLISKLLYFSQFIQERPIIYLSRQRKTRKSIRTGPFAISWTDFVQEILILNVPKRYRFFRQQEQDMGKWNHSNVDEPEVFQCLQPSNMIMDGTQGLQFEKVTACKAK